VNNPSAASAIGVSGMSRRRLVVGGAGFVAAGIALAVATELRPLGDEPTVASYVAAAASAQDRLASVASLYFIAALCLLPGSLGLGGLVSIRGATAIYDGSLMTLAGALWFAIEGAGMIVMRGLLSAPEQAAAILERTNQAAQGALPMVIVLFVFLFAPLVLGIGFRRAHLAGTWLVALWVLSFAVSFAAESQLGADIPVIRTLNSAVLGLVVAAIGLVEIRAAVRLGLERGAHARPADGSLLSGAAEAVSGR
jgi:hypothetical protein